MISKIVQDLEDLVKHMFRRTMPSEGWLDERFCGIFPSEREIVVILSAFNGKIA